MYLLVKNFCIKNRQKSQPTTLKITWKFLKNFPNICRMVDYPDTRRQKYHYFFFLLKNEPDTIRHFFWYIFIRFTTVAGW